MSLFTIPIPPFGHCLSPFDFNSPKKTEKKSLNCLRAVQWSVVCCAQGRGYFVSPFYSVDFHIVVVCLLLFVGATC